MRHETFSGDLTYEYEILPAPSKIERHAGLKTDDERLAVSFAMTINMMAEEGWEYVRADRIDIDNTTGISGPQTKTHMLLVFRRPISVPSGGEEPLILSDRVA